MLYVSHDTGETRRLAGEQARELIKLYGGRPLVIALEGELGAGKTTFVQAFTEVLGVKDKVKSPTFVLMKDYELTGVPGYRHLYHLDCYRLNEAKDLEPLGVKEILNTSGNIILIEWAERVKEILPAKRLVIHIDHITEHTRNITIKET